MRRALLSVTDKQGVTGFAKGLVDAGFSLLSTGGTRRAIAEAGVPVQEVADYTGFPEMMDGRVKTLFPLPVGMTAIRSRSLRMVLTASSWPGRKDL